jgi:hypothetical protein
VRGQSRMAGKAARTNWAMFYGAAQKFTPAPDAWKRIERPLAHTFSSRDRAKIRAKVDRFLDWRRVEGEPFSAVTAPIEALEKAVRSFNGVLTKIVAARSDAGFQAKLAIEHQWRGGNDLGPEKLRALLDLCLSLARDCQHAIKGAPTAVADDSAVRPPLLQRGSTWEDRALKDLLQWLHLFLKRRRLQVTIRNDPDDGGGESDFLLFVWAIFQELPPDARPVLAMSTLGRKINEATRPQRQKKVKVPDAL